MFKAEFDDSRRLLKVAFSKSVDQDEARRGEEQIRKLLESHSGSFRLLTDLTGLDSMELACRPHIDNTMELCREHGVELIVRVIPDPYKDIGFSIMSLFHYGRKTRIVTCESLGEAMAVLDQQRE